MMAPQDMMSMIASGVATAATVVGGGRVLYKWLAGEKSKLIQDYEFAKAFLHELASNPNLHPYVREKGYQALTGRAGLDDTEVVEYILTLEKPERCLRDYMLSKGLLEQVETSGNLRLSFKRWYHQDPTVRKWLSRLLASTYFVCALVALAPLALALPFDISGKRIILLLLITLPTFGYVALSALFAFAKLVRGERLVERQLQHTVRQFIPPSGNGFIERS